MRLIDPTTGYAIDAAEDAAERFIALGYKPEAVEVKPKAAPRKRAAKPKPKAQGE